MVQAAPKKRRYRFRDDVAAGFAPPVSGRGSRTKPSRFGILTFGSVI
jgi:hypothetical protein